MHQHAPVPPVLFEGKAHSLSRYGDMKEMVICAAIKTKDGKVIRGHRHADAIYTARRMRYKLEDLSFADQGFVTSRNRYVSREEGRRLQDAAGIQSADPEGYRGKTLFSEDLY